MRSVLYQIHSITPFVQEHITGFDVEFRLSDGKLAKAELRNNRPSWKRIKRITPEENPEIIISAYNHDLLGTRTMDFEIHEVRIVLF